jgi:hypothetical protein
MQSFAMTVRLKMQLSIDYEQRVIIPFLYNERVPPDKIQERVSRQFGDTTYSLRSVRRWAQFAPQGREDLHDEK